MKRVLVAVVMALAGTAVAAPPCWACSCASSTPKEQAEAADVIFTGRVLKVRGGDADDGILGDDNVKVRFRVKKVYKRHPRRITKVFTNESGAACGFTFKKGKKYTVFADKSDGKKTTNLCSGTKRGGIDHDRYGLPKAYPPQD